MPSHIITSRNVHCPLANFVIVLGNFTETEYSSLPPKLLVTQYLKITANENVTKMFVTLQSTNKITNFGLHEQNNDSDQSNEQIF